MTLVQFLHMNKDPGAYMGPAGRMGGVEVSPPPPSAKFSGEGGKKGKDVRQKGIVHTITEHKGIGRGIL